MSHTLKGVFYVIWLLGVSDLKWIETSPNRLKDVEGNPHILPFLYIGFPQINQDNIFAGDLPACQLKPLPFAVFHEVITRA